MLSPDEISSELYRRKAHLYHAINFPDFRTYLNRGALLSRAQLRTTSAGIGTSLVSDPTDEERGVLDRCFGNLSDFGRLFWDMQTHVPNCYGPIALVFGPTIWKYATDVALTTKNAMSNDYDLAKDRVLDDLDSFFKGPDGAALSYTGCKVEVSTGTNALPLSHLVEIVVEPLILDGSSLVDLVRDAAQDVGLSIAISQRSVGRLGTTRRELLDQLVDWCLKTKNLRRPVQPDPAQHPEVAKWYASLSAQFRGLMLRWCEYTRATIGSLIDEEAQRLWIMEEAAYEKVIEALSHEPEPGQATCSSCGKIMPLECPGCGRLLCYECFFDDESTDLGHQARNDGRCVGCASSLVSS